MHVPDGFLDAPTSLATGVVAVAGIGLALWRSRSAAADPIAPLAGLVATFVMAAQMLNFPVGAGTSGHLLGGALAAVLIGPWLATLAISVVLLVQAVAFADGGLTALGTNVTLMALVGVWTGWAIFAAIRSVLPKRLAMVPIAAAIAAWFSVLFAALTFVGLYAIGGQAPIALDTLTTGMLGVHALIGLGEAAITFLIVSAVITARPDLVYGAGPARAVEAKRRAQQIQGALA
ncbi:energy-coupling factor ABC transporter permease [Janibacter sp. GXQ6167]|uniref:energy-coupling factor ABC transporter permease n=1 Tax=Janibacter sp. GXQ6167 TaxID=3240791 RepID=UPI003523B50B